MAYEFHYTPTGTGVISGKEVLEQTEDAINDLGNTAISGVQEALDKAEQALTNSANAVDDAQTALNTANNAEGVAIQAQTDVGNLSGTVTNIGNRVTTAEGNITNLQGRMTTAEGNVTNLQGRMTTAEGNIGNLQTAVSTAQATANSAQQTATTARQQSYVFRYSSTALTPSSTNSNSLLDNTDNLKVGDKVIDSSGVLFSVTAIDTANSTFTIGTALIDLAQDSDVVHKSGNETVGGSKTFDSNTYVYNSDNTATTPALILKNSKTSKGSTSEIGGQLFRFFDKNNNLLSEIESTVTSNGACELRLSSNTLDSNNQNVKTGLTLISNKNGLKRFCPTDDGNVSCGYSTLKWLGVYAQSYYYGANNVEFSTKFVTTDTNQTIAGNKTFSEDIVINNSDASQTTKRLVITSSKVNLGDSNSDSWGISFNAGSSYVATINSEKSINSVQGLNFTVRTKDGNNNLISTSYRLRIYTDGSAYLIPNATDSISLGSSSNKWKDCQTNQINGLTPSSLSLPSTTGVVDISSYITDLTGTANTYTVLVNGYIQFDVTGSSVEIDVTNGLSQKWIMTDPKGFIPVVSGASVSIKVVGTAINNFKFIPCQGNV